MHGITRACASGPAYPQVPFLSNPAHIVETSVAARGVLEWSRVIEKARKHWGSGVPLPQADSFLPATNQEVARSSRAERILFSGGLRPTGPPYTLSRSLLRHARSVRVAQSLRSLASRRLDRSAAGLIAG
jgi:hypothetical protein